MAYRALVVDDNELARLAVRQFFELMGHEVAAETVNLRTTLESYKKHPPDVVFLDLSLEEDGGLEILRALRKLDAAARVIVISGNSQEAMIRELMDAGASAFLVKPFSLKEFSQAVERVCGGQ